MSKVVPGQTLTASAKLGSYVSGTSVTASGQNNPVGCDSTNTSTSYRAQFTLTRNTSPVVIYNIPVDNSGIPAGATITSVTAKVRCYVSNTTRVTAATVNLYSGSTAKGSAQDFRTTTSSNVETITGSNITLSDLANLRLQFNMTRNNTNTATYMYLFGADVTVTYKTVDQTYYRCTYTSYNETHETSHTLNDDVIPAGSAFRLEFTPTDLNDLKSFTVNGTAVTPSADNYSYVYERSNINADFTINIMCSITPKVNDHGLIATGTAVYKKINGTWVLQPEQNWLEVLSDAVYFKKT